MNKAQPFAKVLQTFAGIQRADSSASMPEDIAASVERMLCGCASIALAVVAFFG